MSSAEPCSPVKLVVVDRRESVTFLDVQGVEGPGLGDVNQPRVPVAQHLIAPQIRYPQNHEEQSKTEAPQQEQAVAVRAAAFKALMNNHGNHSKEGE